MKSSVIVSLSLILVCSISVLGFTSSAEETVNPSDASHTVIVLENVQSSVVEFGESKDQTCSLEPSIVNVDICEYQLGSVGNEPVCFSFGCQLDVCCFGSCPDSGEGGPSEQEDPGMRA